MDMKELGLLGNIFLTMGGAVIMFSLFFSSPISERFVGAGGIIIMLSGFIKFFVDYNTREKVDKISS